MLTFSEKDSFSIFKISSESKASRWMNLLLWTLKGDVSRRASGALVVCPCVQNRSAEQAETAAGAETERKKRFILYNFKRRKYI